MVFVVSLCVAGETTVANTFSNLPLSFEPNRGQAPAAVQYLTRGPGHLLYLGDRGARLRLGDNDLQIEVVDGTSRHITAEKQLPGRVNYLIDEDPSRWRTNIPTFARVRYRDVYHRAGAGEWRCGRQHTININVSP